MTQLKQDINTIIDDVREDIFSKIDLLKERINNGSLEINDNLVLQIAYFKDDSERLSDLLDDILMETEIEDVTAAEKEYIETCKINKDIMKKMIPLLLLQTMNYHILKNDAI